MKNGKLKNSSNQEGFTMTEMMIVLIVILIISAIAVSRLYTGKNEVGGAERLLEDASARITERRADAVRLNGDDRRSRLLEYKAAPLPIDFTDLSKTASLRIDGNDDDRDCVDDSTGQKLTCLLVTDNRGDWNLQFNQDGLKLPDNWQVFNGNRRFVQIPLIGDGINGRGIPATAFAFDATGKAYGKEYGSNDWHSAPTGSIYSEKPSINEAPFWAVYFYVPETNGVRGAFKSAVAVAVHPSGLVERFRYDDLEGAWIGFNNRVVK